MVVHGVSRVSLEEANVTLSLPKTSSKDSSQLSNIFQSIQNSLANKDSKAYFTNLERKDQ